MTRAHALAPASFPGLRDAVPAAWRKRWSAREAVQESGAHPRPPSTSATTGVTYRGYLGATGGDSSSWLSEDQLRDTQALLRLAAKAGRLGAWALELEDMKWTWSEEVRAIHEVPDDFPLTTESALGFYEAQSQARVMAAFEQCATLGTPFDLELLLVTPGGRELWIRTIGEAERDGSGNIQTLRGAIQDITPAKRAAEQATQTAQRLQHTLEMLPDGFVLLDDEWRFLYLNPGAERILRREAATLVGRSLLEEFPETGRGTFVGKCRDAIGGGHATEFTKFYPPLGIWVQFRVWPTEEGLTFCIRDDTERIAARRELLQLRARLEALETAKG